MEPLHDDYDDEHTSTIDLRLIRELERRAKTPKLPEIPDDFDLPRTNTLRLMLSGHTEPLKIRGLTTPITLGRTHEETGSYPSIDLTPHHGQKLGVSRLHAQIESIYSDYYIKDLGSSNGTWVNGRRIEPHQLVPIENGDQIRLGRLMISLL